MSFKERIKSLGGMIPLTGGIFFSALWLLPFIGFVLGYLVTLSFFHTKEIQVPNFVGKSVQYAIRHATYVGLNVRLLREKIDPDIEEGIVLEQMPRQACTIKPNQHVFVTLSKRPQKIITPDVLGCDHKLIAKQCREQGISTNFFWLPSHYPKATCFSQSPQSGCTLHHRPLVSYLSSGRNRLVIFPNLKGHAVGRVKECLGDDGVTIEVLHCDEVHSEHDCSTCTVVDQKPIAGSIIDMGKKLYVQLQVSF